MRKVSFVARNVTVCRDVVGAFEEGGAVGIDDGALVVMIGNSVGIGVGRTVVGKGVVGCNKRTEMTSGIKDYSQWFPGKENDVSDQGSFSLTTGDSLQN